MVLLLAVIYVVFISLGLPDSLFGVSWPVVHLEFGLPESFASLYSIITGACTGGAGLIAGKVIRKFGTGKVTLVSIIITAIGLFGVSFSPNIVIMMLFTILMGYGAGAIDTGLNNFISLHYKSSHMNFLHGFWGVGVTLSPIIMSAFLGEDGSAWRGGYRVVALAELVVALLVLATLSKWKITDDTPQNESDEKSDAKFLDILKIKGVLTAILSLGFYCSMEFLLGTWGASYAVNVFGLTPDEAAKWVSLYYGGIMVGRFICGFLAMTKIKNDTLIRGGLVISIIGMVLFALPIGKLSLLGFLLIGAGFGPIFPGVLHAVPSRFGSTYSADITGFHMTGAYAMGFGVQLLFGYIATSTTFTITPFILLVLCGGAIAMNEITNKLTKKQK